MNELHCTADELQMLIDGALPHGGNTGAAAHVRECSLCRSRYEFLLRFDGAVRSLPLAVAGAGFTDAVMSRLDLSLPAPRGFRFVAWMAYQAGLFVVAAVMVGVFMVTGLIQPEQVQAEKGLLAEALGSFATLLDAGAGAVAGWMKGLIPVPSAGSLTMFADTAIVLLILLLIDRNFARKPLQRTR